MNSIKSAQGARVPGIHIQPTKYLALLFTACIGLFCVPPAARAEITIGLDFGISGNVSRYGEWALRGAELAAEQINGAGGIGGHKLALVLEDNQGSPALAVSAFHKLRTLNHINYILTYQSSIALAVAPLANQAHIVQMDVSAFSAAYSSPDDYTFRTGVLAAQLSRELARRAIEQFNAPALGVLYIENEKGEAARTSFREAYSGRILFEEPFAPNETDYRPVLTRVRAAKAEGLFVSGHLKETGMLLRQAAAMGLRPRIFSDVYSVEGEDFLQAAGEAAEGIVYAAPSIAKGPVGHHFRQLYAARFGEAATFFAAQAYDGVLALAEAMKGCRQIAPECVKDKLYSIRAEGASGTIAFDRFGDAAAKPLEVRVVSGGKFLPLDAGPER